MSIKSNDSCSIPWGIAIMDMLIIAALWCISVIIVNPSGNFPLNDDWSYGLAVKNLLENGDFAPKGWVCMTLITNVLWGSLFCIPAGFSFTALRLSTLTLSLFGILGCYLLMRDLRQPRWLAVITTLTLGFNPIYYALSDTFMTDVPFTAMMLFAALFFARSLKTGSNLHLLIGTSLAIAATLSRQLAIAVPLAFTVSMILTHGTGKRNMLRAVIPLALCLASLLVFQQWLASNGRLPSSYDDRVQDLLHIMANPKMLILALVKNTHVSLLYLGLFLLPVLIFAVADIFPNHRKQTIAIAAFTIAMTVFGCGLRFISGRSPLMPVSQNILIESGIGPLTLRDTYILQLDHVPELPVSFWSIITVISILGASFLIAALVVRAIKLIPRLRPIGSISDNEAVGIFLLLSAGIYLMPLIASKLFDRYFIVAIPFIAAGLAGISGSSPATFTVNIRILRFTGVLLLAAFSIFAICSTKDYLAWNRIRWEALNDLVENKYINARDIDGGLEFNGLYLYEPDYKPDPEKSWWWVHGDTYMIGFQNISGYEVIKEYSYANWMPPHIRKVVVMKKNEPNRTILSDRSRP